MRKLFEAVKKGYIQRVQELIANTTDITALNEEGLSVMHVAAFHGRLEIIMLLISNKCSDLSLLTQQTSHGLTPFHCAVAGGHVECIRCIHSFGGDVVLSQSMTNGFSAAHLAVRHDRLDSLECLAALNCELYQRDEESKTALHYAAEWGHERCCELLLKDHHEMINLGADDGKTPLFFASSNGHIGCVSLLLRNGADPMLPIESVPLTPWGIAASRENADLLRSLLLGNHIGDEAAEASKKSAERYCDALIRSIQSEEANIADYLLELFQKQVGPVQYLAYYGEEERIAILAQNENVDFNLPYREYGVYALHCAASTGNINVVQWLYDNNKCELEKEDGFGRTALCCAVDKGFYNIVHYLLQKGARVLPVCEVIDAKTNEIKESPLERCVCELRLDILSMIWENFCYVTSNELEKKFSLWCQLIKACYYKLSLPYRGCRYLYPDERAMLGYLVTCAEEFFFPLHNLIIECAENPSLTDFNLALFDMLLKGGANPNLKNPEGSTPLHYAANSTEVSFTQLLLDADADISIKNSKERTALCYGVANGSLEVVKCLLLAGDQVLLTCQPYKPLMRTIFGGGSGAALAYAVYNLESDVLKLIWPLFRGLQEVSLNDKISLWFQLLKFFVSSEAFSENRSDLEVRKHIILNYLVLEGESLFTPLHVLARMASTANEKGRYNLNLFRVLLRGGSSVNLQDKDGVTPLHVAAAFGNEEVVKLLLEAGADPLLLREIEGDSRRYSRKKTPSYLAEMRGHFGVLQLLENVELKSETQSAKGQALEGSEAMVIEPERPCLVTHMSEIFLSEEKEVVDSNPEQSGMECMDW